MHIWRFLEQIFTWQFPDEEYVRWGFWMWSMPLLLALTLKAPFYITRESGGRKQRTIRAGLLFVSVILGADVAYYLQAAHLRVNAPSSECTVKGPSPYGPYDALVCVTAGLPQNADTEGFVRLRSTVDGSVLAERDFYNPSFNIVYWAPDYLSVGVADGSAEFALPPTRWDLLRAKLP
ncbi:MAG: hypothetical protein JWQ41_3191 [Variovorax sp.]|nr:hypothetical protein [Variovorax sp.]